MGNQSSGRCRHKLRRDKRQGATIALVAILLPAMFALAAFAINLAYIESVNTEIQIATDAAARAAGREFALTGDQDKALAAAREAAQRNPIGQYVLPITMNDIEFGTSIRPDAQSEYRFTPGQYGNAVRVTTNTLANDPKEGISPIFPIFGDSFLIRPIRTATVTQGEIDIALVVDRSGSMAYSASEVAQFPPAPATAPNGWQFGDAVPPQARWLDLIVAVRAFTRELKNTPQKELLSLSIYNESPQTPQRLTLDYPKVIDELNSLSTQFHAGGTGIGMGMIEGLHAVNDPALSRPQATNVMILMTDGVHNSGRTPDNASLALLNEGVTLYTVTFSDEADQETMRRIARRCGGQHFHAVTVTQLEQAFREIARQLPTTLTQ